jgi:methyl-branched lipid omega-hydroxylase
MFEDMPVATRTNGQQPPQVDISDIDLGSYEFWKRDEDFRHGAFVTLRRHAPIAYFQALARPSESAGRGHWALTTYQDVRFASRHPEIFSSAPTVLMADMAPEVAETLTGMIAMDDPRHQRLRGIVSRAFTPRVLKTIEESIRERARRLVSTMVGNHPDGNGELIAEIAGPLPLQVICDMMGIPESDHQQIFDWTNVIVGFGDDDVTVEFDDFARATHGLGDYGIALAEDRRSNPQDDLTTSLIRAEVDGEQLTSGEIASVFFLLVFAGNETTRNAISHGVLALSRYPLQRQLWWNDFDGVSQTAVEEIVRWSSPVHYMRRTTTEDVVLSGTRIGAGEKVTLWYGSANRDESKFVDPWTFDVRRDPNPHFGYGGGGVHFCLGANLARREIIAVFDELHRQIPDVAASAEPAGLVSSFVNGLKQLPVAWTPPR